MIAFLCFILIYTPAAMLASWCLCLAASKKLRRAGKTTNQTTTEIIDDLRSACPRSCVLCKVRFFMFPLPPAGTPLFDKDNADKN